MVLDYQLIQPIKNLSNIIVDLSRSGWNDKSDTTNLRYTIGLFDITGFPKGVREAADYIFVFGDTYDKETGNRLVGLPVKSKMTNFEILDVTDPANPRKVPFLFSSTSQDITKGSRIFMINADTTNATWALDFLGDSYSTSPELLEILFL